MAVTLAAPVTGFTTLWGVTINPSAAVLGAIALLLAFLLWRAQRDEDENSFDFWDLVMDDITPTASQPNRRRKASVIKLSFLGAFLLSSWAVFDQEIKASPLLPTVFGIYMATWGVSLIAKVIFDKKDAPTFSIPGGK